MKDTTLATLAPLLEILRTYPVLDEVRTAAFHLNGRDFIHFHEEPEGLFADVRLAEGRVRMPVATAAEQAELLARIERKLSALEAHAQGRRSKRRGRPGRER